MNTATTKNNNNKTTSSPKSTTFTGWVVCEKSNSREVVAIGMTRSEAEELRNSYEDAQELTYPRRATISVRYQ